MVVPDLRPFSSGLGRIVQCHVNRRIAQRSIITAFLSSPDTESIGLWTGGGDEDVFPHRNLQPSALAQCIMGNALMPAEDAIALRDETARSRHLSTGCSGNKGSIVIVRQETDFLTVRLMRHMRSRFRWQDAEFVFRLFTHRHAGMGQLLVGLFGTRVGLVFRRGNGMTGGKTKVLQPGNPRIVLRDILVRPSLQAAL